MTAPANPTTVSQPEKGGASNTRSSSYIVAASILGSSMAFVDGSVVNVALPAIDAGLHPGGADISWAITAYLIPVGALTLLGGAIGDRLGSHKLFVFGIIAFIAASLVCATAPNFAIFILGRTLQGVAAAVLMPNSLAMLGAAFEGERRSSAIATWAAAGSLTGAIGPLVGGVLVDSVGWRPIFLLNVPLGATAAWLAVRHVKDAIQPAAIKDLDWSGSLIATAALGILTWMLTEAAKPQTALWPVVLSGILVAQLCIVFVAIERAKREKALVPFAMFGTATFISLTLFTLFLYAAMGGFIVVLPFVLIRYAEYSAAAAGAALLPVSLIIGLGSRLAGKFSSRFGAKRMLVTGALIVTAGMLAYGTASGPIDYWKDVLPGTLLVAIGMAICVAPLTTAVMNAVDTAHIGAASGLNSATARIGGLIAAALLAFVFVRQGSDAQLLFSFKVASFIGAAVCIAAAASAFLLMKSDAR